MAVLSPPTNSSKPISYTDAGLRDFAITKGIDNARLDAAATLPLELGLAGTKAERQVEAGEHRVGVLSQLLLDIATSLIEYRIDDAHGSVGYQ
ncbi:hypothetical protein [Synechococcus sp. NOUM97013]|uniref:hypothetical protein n=1 Tax=Synechococcus sp. NOUM97013 TaxID=1442555 RepID=UPI0016453765|nr:hypothetical protein [Synechococcus sp. NOUM97013]QNI74295.1 hypothetical protein SynNOUM97013_02242 [Synechococcus sp. NOUM97013]